jgi:hypothetical protein
MIDVSKLLTAASTISGCAGAWCIGWSVIDKFKGFELSGGGIGGSTMLSPEYRSWMKRNDRRTRWGLGLVTLGAVLQIFVLYAVP